MTPGALAGASCAHHPSAGAVELCSRCGAFLCGECVLYVREVVPVCGSCLPLVEHEGPPTRAAWASPLLASVGLVLLVAGFFVRGRPGLGLWAGGLPLGAAGVFFGARELRRIARQRAPRRGRWLAWAGLAVSLPFVLLGVALLVAFTLFLTGRLGAGR